MSTPVDLYTFYAAVSGFAIWAAGIRCAFERAVPTAAVMIVEEIISLIALNPTITQHPTMIFLPPIRFWISSVFPNIITSALIKNSVFRKAEKNPVTAQDT